MNQTALSVGSIFVSLAFLSVCPSPGQTKQGSTPCKEVLEGGVMKQFRYESRTKLDTDIAEMLRMSDEQLLNESKKSSGRGQLALQIVGKLGLSGGGGGDVETKRLRAIRQTLQQDTKATLAADDSTYVLQTSADWIIVDAWRDCMKNWLASQNREGAQTREEGLQMEILESQDDKIVLTVSWRKPSWPGAPDNVDVTNIWLVGVDYEQPLGVGVGTQVGPRPVRQIFRRIDGQEVIIVLAAGEWDSKIVMLQGKSVISQRFDREHAWAMAAAGELQGADRVNVITALMFPPKYLPTAAQAVELLGPLESPHRDKAIMNLTLFIQHPIPAEDLSRLLRGVEEKNRPGVVFFLKTAEMRQRQELAKRRQELGLDP